MTISTDYGTLTDYITGEAIRPATAAEHTQSLAAGETGAFELDGRAVFVAGGSEGDLTETARLALVYDEDEGPYRGQLHAAYPWLGTMASTAAWLGSTWHAPEAEDLEDLHLDKTEPSDLLHDAWRMVVQRIADGWTPEN